MPAGGKFAGVGVGVGPNGRGCGGSWSGGTCEEPTTPITITATMTDIIPMRPAGMEHLLCAGLLQTPAAPRTLSWLSRHRRLATHCCGLVRPDTAARRGF